MDGDRIQVVKTTLKRLGKPEKEVQDKLWRKKEHGSKGARTVFSETILQGEQKKPHANVERGERKGREKCTGTRETTPKISGE